MGKIFGLIVKLSTKKPNMDTVYDLWKNEYRHETQEYVFENLRQGTLDKYIFTKVI